MLVFVDQLDAALRRIPARPTSPAPSNQAAAGTGGAKLKVAVIVIPCATLVVYPTQCASEIAPVSASRMEYYCSGVKTFKPFLKIFYLIPCMEFVVPEQGSF
ncbi:MAG: hypothetical protein ACOX5Z_11470 [Desulfobulbus sp.]|jgi:hypothetical protein